MSFFVFVLSISIGILVAGLCLWIGHILLLKVTFLHNPVFIRSLANQLTDALALFSIADVSKVADLGSGDGTALLALAKKFPQAEIIGVEINPWLVRSSRKTIKLAGLSHRVKVHQKSLWLVNLGDFDRVYLYGSSYIMEQLEKKVVEMRPGSQLISVRFPFPTLRCSRKKGEAILYQF